MIIITSTENGICGLYINAKEELAEVKKYNYNLTRADVSLSKIKYQLNDYFNAKIRKFECKFDFLWGAGFPKKAWMKLEEIPYGEICSYKWLAIECGKEKVFRAIGSAVGKNPIPIILPCHRVFNNDGGIDGFGYGVPMKVKLLKIDGVDLNINPTGISISAKARL